MMQSVEEKQELCGELLLFYCNDFGVCVFAWVFQRFSFYLLAVNLSNMQ